MKTQDFMKKDTQSEPTPQTQKAWTHDFRKAIGQKAIFAAEITASFRLHMQAGISAGEFNQAEADYFSGILESSIEYALGKWITWFGSRTVRRLAPDSVQSGNDAGADQVNERKI